MTGRKQVQKTLTGSRQKRGTEEKIELEGQSLSMLKSRQERCDFGVRMSTTGGWNRILCQGSDKTDKARFVVFLVILSEVSKRGRPSKWPPECLPSKFADFECAFSP